MKKMFSIKAAIFLAGWLACASSFAATKVESFEIEGLISPASPKALTSELETRFKVKVLDLNLKNTDSGWPVMRIEFDTGSQSRETLEQAIASIEDPAGHKYRVHQGPPMVNAPYIDEEIAAATQLGPASSEIVAMTNPVEASDESRGRGKLLYNKNCTTCHGLSGGGNGPAAHGIATFPRQLWVWHNTDASADGYLYWFITNGRNEMPPWGLILSENDRWDLINYIKTLAKPE